VTATRRLARGYSYSDRVRYYWPDSQIDDAFERLVRNLADEPIPLPLISQYLPLQYSKFARGSQVNATGTHHRPHSGHTPAVPRRLRRRNDSTRIIKKEENAMPNIVLCRIDERLIHGQVGVQWVGLRGQTWCWSLMMRLLKIRFNKT
jgi:hypothetical protein